MIKVKVMIDYHQILIRDFNNIEEASIFISKLHLGRSQYVIIENVT